MNRPTAINTKEFVEWAWDRNLRIGQIVPMATACDNGEVCEPIRDLLSDETDEGLGKIFGPQLAACLSARRKEEEKYGDELDDEQLRECFSDFVHTNRMYGFLIDLETPVKKWQGRTASYSWGHCYTGKLYVADLAGDFFDKVEAWLKAREDSNRRKSGSASGSASSKG